MYGHNIFHNEIMTGLINTVRKGTNAHAFLFCGERGLAKHECARLLSQTLVCENTEVAPCGHCEACKLALAGTNPDIINIEREKDKKQIGVDVMREAIANASLKPYGSKSKVFIVNEGELLGEAAQNAFLKTLEEPPEYTVFIIVTSTADVMLSTVLSRCTKINFPSVKRNVLEKYIDQNYPNEDKNFLCNFSEGNPSRIDEYVNNEEFRNKRLACFDILKYFISDHMASAFDVAKYAEDNKDEIDSITDMWLGFLRDLLMVQIGYPNNIFNSDLQSDIRRLSAMYSEKRILRACENIMYLKEMIKRNVKLRTAVMSAVLKTKKTKE